MFLILLLLLSFNLLHPTYLISDEQEDLFKDLLIVDYWNKKLNKKLPVTFNNQLEGGYFAMPSARMGKEGEIGIGYSHVPPYRNYNIRFQLFKNFELIGNYRIFHHIKDPVLSQYGFGDFSDKGINFKYALFLPEDSDYQIPGIAFGMNDFLGTCAFKSSYVVATQVFLNANLEFSIGYGIDRIKGFFGGITYFPFQNTCWKYFKNLNISLEYDATPYHKPSIEPHPKGRIKKSPLNYGLKYRLFDCMDFSLSYIRGDALACSFSTFYDFGHTQGFLPKIDNAQLYPLPLNNECSNIFYEEAKLGEKLLEAFQEQGFDIWDIWISYDPIIGKILRIVTLNDTYRMENEVRGHLNNLIAALIPSDINEVIVVIDSEGFPIQEYHYKMNFVRLYQEKQISAHELLILTPLTEVSMLDTYNSYHLFGCKRECLNMEVSPKTYSLFGSSTGKFKYTLGVHLSFNGYLWNNTYYNILFGLNFLNNMGKINNYDRLNPSQIINVRSDIVRYFLQKGVTLDAAYLQKNWSLGKGWYSRIAAGYFEEEYGGCAMELLYSTLNSSFSIGIEGAILKKRSYKGFGFTNKIRKLEGFRVSHKKFLGSQYFLNFYYDLSYVNIDFKIAVGKFLANDFGVRNEISRYFQSGLRISLWYTLTNGRDKINGKTYYDKGISFSMPFDIFYTCSERTYWNYGMSAWLRDVGVQAMTGMNLYELINNQRQ